jgi:hypothetical protein
MDALRPPYRRSTYDDNGFLANALRPMVFLMHEIAWLGSYVLEMLLNADFRPGLLSADIQPRVTNEPA